MFPIKTRSHVVLQQVWDNGEGMSAEGLRQWAVMNLSMEDRGMQPTQPTDVGDSGAGSFLDAQLSFFGVRLRHPTALAVGKDEAALPSQTGPVCWSTQASSCAVLESGARCEAALPAWL